MARPCTRVIADLSVDDLELLLGTWPESEMKGLILYPLPPYSPELNEIEHRWKHIKTSELPAAAWKNLSSLVGKLTEFFTKLGRFVLMPSTASG